MERLGGLGVGAEQGKRGRSSVSLLVSTPASCSARWARTMRARLRAREGIDRCDGLGAAAGHAVRRRHDEVVPWITTVTIEDLKIVVLSRLVFGFHTTRRPFSCFDMSGPIRFCFVWLPVDEVVDTKIAKQEVSELVINHLTSIKKNISLLFIFPSCFKKQEVCWASFITADHQK